MWGDGPQGNYPCCLVGNFSRSMAAAAGRGSTLPGPTTWKALGGVEMGALGTLPGPTTHGSGSGARTVCRLSDSSATQLPNPDIKECAPSTTAGKDTRGMVHGIKMVVVVQSSKCCWRGPRGGSILNHGMAWLKGAVVGCVYEGLLEVRWASCRQSMMWTSRRGWEWPAAS